MRVSKVEQLAGNLSYVPRSGPPGEGSWGVSSGSWRASLFQDKYPYCVPWASSQPVYHSWSSTLRGSFKGRRKGCTFVCAKISSWGSPKCHISWEHNLPTPRIRLRNDLWVYQAKSSLLSGEKFLIRFVGGQLTLPPSDEFTEAQQYVLQRCQQELGKRTNPLFFFLHLHLTLNISPLVTKMCIDFFLALYQPDLWVCCSSVQFWHCLQLELNPTSHKLSPILKNDPASDISCLTHVVISVPGPMTTDLEVPSRPSVGSVCC